MATDWDAKANAPSIATLPTAALERRRQHTAPFRALESRMAERAGSSAVSGYREHVAPTLERLEYANEAVLTGNAAERTRALLEVGGVISPKVAALTGARLGFAAGLPLGGPVGGVIGAGLGGLIGRQGARAIASYAGLPTRMREMTLPAGIDSLPVEYRYSSGPLNNGQ